MPSFLVILMFCAFISIHFCGFISVHSRVLSLHVLSFWLFVAPFAFMSAFCGCVSVLWFSPFVASFPFSFAFSPFIVAFWAFISFRFCLLTLPSLLFVPSHPSFPFILAFSPFISFYFGLLGLHFLSFLPSHPSFWSFGLSFTVHFLLFWPFGSSCPFILTPWVFM